MYKKKALITFLGNINYDTRCFNLYNSLIDSGYEVEFVGFDWLTEGFESVKGPKTIYKLTKKFPSILFYLKFFSILKYNLLKRKYDILFAEDLYTLPVCIVIGKLKGAKIIYDCRELFGFLAGLKNKPFIQRLWRTIEKFFINKSNLVLVTGKMDQEFIKKEYGLKSMFVLRNLPLFKKSDSPIDFYNQFGIKKDKKILIYQGVVVHGRGLKIIFEILRKSDNFVLIVLGDGEHLKYYQDLSKSLSIDKKVFFAGKISQEKLINYTTAAFVGLSLIENLSLSYYYALPNKLFEYIMAEVPVIATNLPQMKEIIDEFKVGFVVEENDFESITQIIERLNQDNLHYNQLKENCRKASEILCWENEFKLHEKRFQEILS
jgi:glycosyltransferase involved in cell wall biosynthesis